MPEVFATISWFYALQLHLGVNTVVAVQRATEPTTPERAAAVSRRWRAYKSGKQKPSAQTVNLAEKLTSWPRAILHSPLWDALRLDRSPDTVARKLLGTTSKEGDDLLKWMLDRHESHSDPRWIRKRCRAMVARGNLEGLAILTVCVKLAGKRDASSLALTFYRHATDCLVILGSWLYAHGIAQALAEYYEKILLPAYCQDHQFGVFSSDHYLRAVYRLDRAILAIQKKDSRKLTTEEVITAMVKILDI
mgnify:CR=1 FL=1